MLQENETYYYSYRHLFRDGHNSRMSQPVVFKTTTDVREATIDFAITEDLDHSEASPSYADIELFRKTGSGGMVYIDTLKPDQMTIDDSATIKTVEFVDDGVLGGGKVDEKETTNTLSHFTQTEIQDRLVKANVVYPNRQIDEYDTFTIEAVDQEVVIGQPMLPNGVDVQMFARGVFQDGQKSFHRPVSNLVSIEENFKTLAIDADNNIENVSTKGLSEISLYLKVEEAEQREEKKSVVPFNTIEINNSNIPTLQTFTDPDGNFFFNQKPHVFIGWKYFRRRILSESDNGDGTYTIDFVDEIKETGFDTYDGQRPSTPNIDLSDSLYSFFPFNHQSETVTASSSVEALQQFIPDHIDAEIVEGQPMKYSKHIRWNGGQKMFWYKMSIAESLKNAVNVSDVRLRMKSATPSDLSVPYANNEYLGFEEDIDFIYDESEGSEIRGRVFDYSGTTNEPYLSIPDSKLYAVLDTDSIYSELDNYELINDSVSGEYHQTGNDGIPNGYDVKSEGGLAPVAEFELTGIEYELGEIDSVRYLPFPRISETYQNYIGLQADVFTVTKLDENFLEDNLIFIGSYFDLSSFNTRLSDSNKKLIHTGFELDIEESYKFIKLTEDSLYESRILAEDINTLENEFTNQLVWSEKSSTGASRTASRQFLYTSFLNISSQYGPIIKLASIRNDLLIFCERGVALIKTGERMARSNSGDIYIQSSQFLSEPIFILKSAPFIQKYSIVEHESGIYFCDGRDLWSYTDKLNNLTQGKINIDGFAVGGVDPKHSEYRLSVFDKNRRDPTTIKLSEALNPKTYTFSFDAGEWAGPHSYGAVANAHISDEMVSFVDTELAVQNRGNLFGATEYETIIESTANTMNEPSREKLFRKFYLNAVQNGEVEEEDTNFSYATNYFENPYTIDLFDRRKIRGTYPIGIRADEGRPSVSPHFFWQIRTVAGGFLLRSLSFDYLWK